MTHMQIKRIEKEIRDTPYHKATEHHIGRLRAKLSKLKAKLDKPGGKSGGGGGYAVKKQGDATVVLAGPPSVGKSTLLNKLTNAQSKIAPYAFTTVSVIPGMMTYKDANIQILDVPGLIEGAEEGKGRGREVLSVIRGADLLIIMTQIDKPDAIKRIEDTLEANGIRLNKQPPDVAIDKKLTGGLILKTNIDQELGKETIKEVAREMGIKNAEINLKQNLSMEQLIDAFSSNRAYIPSLVVINKTDLADQNDENKAQDKIVDKAVFISAEEGYNIKQLKNEIWEQLGFVRIYLVRQDEDPGMNNPLIVDKNSDLNQVKQIIGSDFASEKERAKIWGAGAKFPGQEVSLSTKVVEGMQVRFI